MRATMINDRPKMSSLFALVLFGVVTWVLPALGESSAFEPISELEPPNEEQPLTGTLDPSSKAACPPAFVPDLIPGSFTLFGSEPGTVTDIRDVEVFDDGTGPALYAAGSFHTAGGRRVDHLARWTGVEWVAASPGFDAPVNDLEVFDAGNGPELYAIGAFEYVGATKVNALARFDGRRWQHAGGGFDQLGGRLAVYDDGEGPKLYATGIFDHAGHLTAWHGGYVGVAVPGFAVWDGQRWAKVGDGTLEVFGEMVASSLGGAPRLILKTLAGLSAWDGEVATPILNDVAADGALAMADDGTGAALYVVDTFSSGATTYLKRWDGSQWSTLTDAPNGIVSLLAVQEASGPALYAGGDFAPLAGVPQAHLARLKHGVWSFLDPGTSESVGELAVRDLGLGPVVLGEVGDQVARWTGTDWAPLGGPATDGSIFALASFDDGRGPAVYAAGSFSRLGEFPVAHIVRWDGISTFEALGSGLSGTVYALAVFDDGTGEALYAGGDFSTAGGAPAAGIARWDGAAWSAVGEGLPAAVRSLAAFDLGSGPVLVAAGGAATNEGFLRAWNGTSWVDLAPSVNGRVNTLAVADLGGGPALYAGGHFTSIGGVAAAYVARFQAGAWTALAAGTNGSVWTLVPWSGGGTAGLAVGGAFTEAGGLPRLRVAHWTAAGWGSLGTGLGGATLTSSERVEALTTHDDGTGLVLYAGGTFIGSSSNPKRYLARLTTSWTEVGGGMDGPVSALRTSPVAPSALLVGGSFAGGGGVPSRSLALLAVPASCPAQAIELEAPPEGASIAGSVLLVSGRLRQPGSVWVNGVRTPVSSALTFSAEVALAEGENLLRVEADLLTRPTVMVASATRTVHRDTRAPTLVWLAPQPGATAWVPRPELRLSAADAGSGVDPASLVVQTAGSTVPTSCRGSAGALVCTPLADLPAGAVTLSATIADHVGRRSTPVARSFTVAPEAVAATTLVGTVHLADGSPAPGATIHVLGVAGSSATAAADGSFTLAAVPVPFAGALTVTAELATGAEPLLAVAQVTPVPGGVTDAGVLVLALGCRPALVPTGVLGAGLEGGATAKVAALTVWDDGSGPALYAGGSFTGIGGVAAAHLAKWNGATWSPVGAGTNGMVRALAVWNDGTGTALYLGGDFSQAGGVAANRVARFNGTTFSPLGAGVSGGTYASSRVHALLPWNDGSGEALYVAGLFTSAGGSPAASIARWDGSSFVALGSGLTSAIFLGSPYAYTLAAFDDGSGPALYAGGNFTHAGGLVARRIARWNGTLWAPLGEGVGIAANDGPGVNVSSFAVFDDGSGPALFVGGAFSFAGALEAHNVARWRAGRFERVGDGLEIRGFGAEEPNGVEALFVWNDGTGNYLYAAGIFDSSGGRSLSRLARFDGASWQGVGGGLAPETVGGMAFASFNEGAGSRLFVAGGFLEAGGTPASGVARFDGQTFSALGTGTEGSIHAFALFDEGAGPALYAAGDFVQIAGVPARRIARFDGQRWSAVGAGFSATVRTLAVWDDGGGAKLFAGGDFQRASGDTFDAVAAWDGSSWQGLGSGFSGGSVRALLSAAIGGSSRLYATGPFTLAGGTLANRIAAWDGAHWSALGTGLSAEGRALALYGGELVVGGTFTSAGGGAAQRIAAWNGTAWRALGTGFDNTVNALTLWDDGAGPKLAAGGRFTTAGTVPASRVALWNGSSWTGLPTIPSGPNAEVLSLQTGGDGLPAGLFAGGTYTSISGTPAGLFVHWNGQVWNTLGSGADGPVRALLSMTDQDGPALALGGGFLRLGGLPSAGFGFWRRPDSCTPEPDTTAPVLSILQPRNAAYVSALPTIELAWSDERSGVRASTLAFTLDGAALATSCTARTSGATCQPAAPLAEGAHTLMVSVADYAGTRSATQSLAFTVDQQPPTLSFTQPVAGSSVRSATPSLRLGWSDASAGIDTTSLVVARGGVALSLSGCSFTSTSATCTPGQALPDGAVTLTATVRDKAGNPSPTAAVSFTIDTVPPALSFATPADGAVVGSRPTLTFTATDTGSGLDLGSFALLRDGLARTAACTLDGATLSCLPSAPLPDGTATYVASIKDRAGNASVLTARAFTSDGTAPSLTITRPTSNAVVRTATPAISLVWSDAGSGVEAASLEAQTGGASLPVTCEPGTSGATCTPVSPLAEGPVSLAVTVRDRAGNLSATATVSFRVATGPAVDDLPPSLAFVAPTEGGLLDPNTQALRLWFGDQGGSGVNPSTLSFEVNGAPVTALCSACATSAVCALDGPTSGDILIISARLADHAGNEGTATVRFATRPGIDLLAPRIALLAPQPGSVTPRSSVWFRGSVSEPASLTLNGTPVPLSATGTFLHGPVPLAPGENLLTLLATDAAGNQGEQTVRITRDAFIPPALDLSRVTVLTTSPGRVEVSGSAGAVPEVRPGMTLELRPPAGRAIRSMVVSDGSFFTSAPALPGDTLQLAVLSASGVRGPVGSVVVPGVPPALPDPASLAPPVDPTLAGSLCRDAAFLWEGEAPLQFGVAPDALPCERVVLVRGRVSTRDGAPLAGVRVSALGRPEFGFTVSRVDGVFDLAVAGAGAMTFELSAGGYLPAQRTIDLGWREFRSLPEVVLVERVAAVAPVAPESAVTVEVARGPASTDAAGTRRPTLLFSPGTAATAVLTDGSSLPLSTLALSATEYSVGPRGVLSLPAELPASLSPTYTVELNIREAEELGAEGVTFDRPVIFYLENFPSFPVGSNVPVASLDRTRGVWTPEGNGRVIKVLALSGGLATLDVAGTGQEATATALSSLGISDGERATLATLYSAGTTVWRVPLTHLSAYTMDWPFGFLYPASTMAPDLSLPESGDDDRLERPSYRFLGGAIEAENQILRQSLALAGTPFALHYASDRTPGRKAAFRLFIPLTDDTVPANLKRVDLRLSIAGEEVVQSFAPLPAQTHVVEWDGRDRLGRLAQGKETWEAKLSYVYDGLFHIADSGSPAFGEISGIRLESIPLLHEASMSRESTGQLGGFLALEAFGLGGFSLSVHHVFDPATKTLYYGNGRRRELSRGPTRPDVLEIVAGNGSSGTGGDGGPARDAQLAGPHGLAVMRDGSLLITESASGRIRKVAPDGTIATVAGCGCPETPGGGIGDLGPATAARLSFPSKAIEGPDGALYIADTGHNRIRRVDEQGIITTFAGTGAAGCGGEENDPAVISALHTPTDIAFDAAGNLLIAEHGSPYSSPPCRHLKKIKPDGTLSIVLEDRNYPQGNPASFPFFDVAGVASGTDGSIYFSQPHAVRRMPPTGEQDPQHPGWSLAGAGLFNGGGFAGDGEAAGLASLLNFPQHLALARDRTLYVADALNGRIRRINAAGILSTVAGGGELLPTADGLPATEAALVQPIGVALDPRGEVLYLSDALRHMVFKMVTPDGLGDETIVIPSEDGQVLDVFDASGRHLRTESALSGEALFTFTYTSIGAAGSERQLLTEIRDLDGNVTTIERDSEGAPTAVVGPYGQRTLLTVDPVTHYLAEVRRELPGATERVELSFNPDGLLLSLKDPKNALTTFTWDEDGRLTQSSDPAAGSLTLSTFETAGGYAVDQTTAEGRQSRTTVELPDKGGLRQVLRNAAGLETVIERHQDGSLTITAPDDTELTVDKASDPRLGFEAPYTKAFTLTTPEDGRRLETTRVRTVGVAANDPLFLLSQTDRVTVNGRTATTTYTASTKTVASTSPEGRTASTVLDDRGRPVEGRLPGVEPVRRTYDERGRVVSVAQGTGPAERLSLFTYNDAGRLATATDPLLREVRFEYDAVGRVTKKTLPDGREVRFTYDVNGNLTSLTPPGRPSHDFAHTPVNQTESYTPPDVVPGSDATLFAYNDDHQLTTVTRPDLATVALGYDAAGRVAHITTPEGVTSYSYDTQSGHVTTVTAPGGATITVDRDGPLVESLTMAGPVSGTVEFDVDHPTGTPAGVSNFWVSSTRLNGDEATRVNREYDDDGLLTKLGEVELFYRADNAFRIGLKMKKTGERVERNAFGEVTKLESGLDDGSCTASAVPFAGCVKMLVLEFVRDKTGRITQKQETLRAPGGGSAETHTYDYRYDDAGRLVEVKRDGALWESYTYDANGNRTSWADPWGGGTGTYDAQDRLVSTNTATYTYTKNGELTSKVAGPETTTYRYDVFGNLKRVELPNGVVIEYVIDASNRRIGKKVNGTLVQGFLYAGGISPIAEVTPTGAVVAQYLYGTGGNVPDAMIKGGVTYRIITDHLGSVRWVLNAQTGEVAQRMDYDAWGRVMWDSNPGFTPFGFAGGLYEPQTGLVRFGARDYDAAVGRWTAKDPIGFGGGLGNLYSYVGSDPINLTDPSGKALPLLVGGLLLGGFFISEAANTPTSPEDPQIPNSEGNAQLAGMAVEAVAGHYLEKFFGFLGRSWRAFRGGGAVVDDLVETAVPTTRLYRAVSPAELDDIAANGFRPGPNSLGGKFFAESADDAARWGDALEGPGNYRVIEIEVPSTAADSFTRWERLDNIGPARYGELDQLQGLLVREVDLP